MCWYVYIATPKPIENPIWRPNPEAGVPPLLHFELISNDPERYDNAAVRPLFKAPYLYYVGSSSGCSCHLANSGVEFDETGNVQYNYYDSAAAFLDFIREYTLLEPLDMYAVWENAWEEGTAAQPLVQVQYDVTNMTLADYFDLKSRWFYTFYRSDAGQDR